MVWAGKNLDQIVPEFTRKLARIWRIHPFRDGNTRTTLAFAENYAREHGFPMEIAVLLDNLTRIKDESGKVTRYSIRDKFVLAALDDKDYPEPEHLERLIKQSIQVGIEREKEKHNMLLGRQKDDELTL